MSGTFIPTPPQSRGDAARCMAELQDEMDRIAKGATPVQIIGRLVADGAEVGTDEGLIFSWIEHRFPHLVGMVTITDENDLLIIRGEIPVKREGGKPDTFRVLESLNPAYKYVDERGWREDELRRLGELEREGFFDTDHDKWAAAGTSSDEIAEEREFEKGA